MLSPITQNQLVANGSGFLSVRPGANIKTEVNTNQNQQLLIASQHQVMSKGLFNYLFRYLSYLSILIYVIIL